MPANNYLAISLLTVSGEKSTNGISLISV